MHKRNILCCLAAFAITASAFAQTSASNPTQVPPSRLTFVSATIEPSPFFDTSAAQANAKATQVKFYAMSLRELIMMAYNVKIYQISGPSWLPDQRFDVIATMPDGASPSDTPAMLQALLEDRFKLVARRETKNRATLSLKLAKGGPKLLPAADPQVNPPRMPAGPISTTVNGHDGSTLMFSRATMDGLAEVLTYLLHGPFDSRLSEENITEDEDVWGIVVNQTGLTGEYQVAVNSSLDSTTIDLRIANNISGSNPTPTARPTLGPARGVPEGDPMVYASLGKLGLDLKSSSAKLEVLVISHAEKNPTPN